MHIVINHVVTLLLVGRVRQLIWLNTASQTYSYYWTLIGNSTTGIWWNLFQPLTPNLGTSFHFWHSGAFRRITTPSCATFALHHRCRKHSATVSTCWYTLIAGFRLQDLWVRRVSCYTRYWTAEAIRRSEMLRRPDGCPDLPSERCWRRRVILWRCPSWRRFARERPTRMGHPCVSTAPGMQHQTIA